MDAAKTDLRQWQIRPDMDYGMVWIKSYGKGRVFNSVLGHRPEFYSNPNLVKLMLGGIQFVLGDLEADTTICGVGFSLPHRDSSRCPAL